MKKFFTLFLVVLLGAFLLSACQPAEPQVIKETVVVEVPVEVQVEVPAEPVEKTVVEFWTTDNEEA
ncbi:MAG: hypothetical protein MUP11_05680, partial [Anaerolineales bacterium]|nr:hypothetical protein [Anaerolineales bacterium]